VYKHEHKHSGLHESTVVGLFCFLATRHCGCGRFFSVRSVCLGTVTSYETFRVSLLLYVWIELIGVLASSEADQLVWSINLCWRSASAGCVFAA